MAAFLTINFNGKEKVIQFYVGEKPEERYQGVKPDHVQSIQLDETELAYAQSSLGAAPINKRVVTYFGDEARRIFFNW